MVAPKEKQLMIYQQNLMKVELELKEKTQFMDESKRLVDDLQSKLLCSDLQK